METNVQVKNQRRDARTELTWPVSVWLPEANRFFNAKSVNISKGGALLSAPMTMPLRVGHKVELNFPRTLSLARKKGRFARIKAGKVLRVERQSATEDATIRFAVQFV